MAKSANDVSTIVRSGSESSVAAFGRFLVEASTIDAATLGRAERAADSSGERLDRVLTKLGLLSEADLSQALARFLSIALVGANELPVEPILLDMAPAAFVAHNQVMPLRVDNDVLLVGITDPFKTDAVRALSYVSGLATSPLLFVPADFERAYASLYQSVHPAQADYYSKAMEASKVDVERLMDLANEAPTIRLVNQIITKAVEELASDIHIEPQVDALDIRYRIDGVLQQARRLAEERRSAIVSRIKLLSKLDIAERRLPQDGRIQMAVRGRDVDIRVSTLPTAFGESVVLRLLDKARVELDFDKLGFDGQQIETFGTLLKAANGIVLVTGPTGSGKTTTLYTALSSLDRKSTKIITVEDPIEYQISGINQVQAQPGIGLDFPRALRSILRQDPDVIMVGEMRDAETARIAIQAALTGHLVLSTLHTNSAIASVTRLIDMGLEPFLLASTIKGVLAQRLVRRLCSRCATPLDRETSWSQALMRQANLEAQYGAPRFMEPQGCTHCNGTGYRGQTTIAELLIVNAQMQSRIAAGAGESELAALAQQNGMRSLFASGVTKAWLGQTSIEEVLLASHSE